VLLHEVEGTEKRENRKRRKGKEKGKEKNGEKFKPENFRGIK
jgi:hypothetical protein